MSVKVAQHFLIVLTLIFFAFFLLIISGFVAPLVFGILLAGLAHPLYAEFLRKFGNRENLAALLSALIISIVILLPFFLLLTLLTKEAIHLITEGNIEFIGFDRAVSYLAPIAAKFNINLENLLNQGLGATLNAVGSAISNEIGSFLSNALATVVSFFLTVVTLFYMLRDGKFLGEFLIDISPLKTKDELTLYHAFIETGKAVFYGTFVASLVQGVLGGIGFALFGLPAPVLWGAIMGFLALLPFLGPYLIFIPASIFFFVNGEILAGIGFLLYNMLIVSTIDNLVKPKMISERVKIHPLLILIAIIGGIKAFGLIGIIYGPLITAIFLALIKVYRESAPHETIQEAQT